MIAGNIERERRGGLPGGGSCWLLGSSIFLGYGLNFLAIKAGVESMPAFLFGGCYLVFLGAVLREFGQITEAEFGWKTVSAFLFLLFVHSLAAFTAMN